MAPYRRKKPAPTDLSTDEEDMITYDVEEDELEQHPDLVQKDARIGSCAKNHKLTHSLRCFRCQSYGHGTASCRGVATCNKCSSTEHASEACTTERRKCANCKGEHAAFSKICPKWQQEKEIQRIKVLENISYSEAKKRWSTSYHLEPPLLYANAVITNTKSKDTATQTDMELKQKLAT
ncbi:putative adenylate cyclase type 3-like protein [Trichonephila clavipes]|nr:putative adenylate cyclase type 3-like protein [Trichonephila clavipes]